MRRIKPVYGRYERIPFIEILTEMVYVLEVVDVVGWQRFAGSSRDSTIENEGLGGNFEN